MRSVYRLRQISPPTGMTCDLSDGNTPILDNKAQAGGLHKGGMYFHVFIGQNQRMQLHVVYFLFAGKWNSILQYQTTLIIVSSGNQGFISCYVQHFPRHRSAFCLAEALPNAVYMTSHANRQAAAPDLSHIGTSAIGVMTCFAFSLSYQISL